MIKKTFLPLLFTSALAACNLLCTQAAQELTTQTNTVEAESADASLDPDHENIKTEDIPEDLLTFLADYPEVYSYVKDYPEKHDLHPKFDLTPEAASEEVPLLIQWDERWGYAPYGNGGLIGYKGCGPVCISMVALYLTDNPEYTPIYMADFTEKNGYYVQGIGTSWELMSTGCEVFGLQAQEACPDEETIKSALDQKHPIICSVAPGDFTKHGHFIVLKGYDENGLSINDPNSLENSQKTWDFARVLPQIKAMWIYQPS